MLSLGITGYAYAHWTQKLFINGKIKSGELNVIFYEVSDNDNGADPGYDTDVGDTTAEIVDPHHIRVNVSNVYPFYKSNITIILKNVGTIPAKNVAWDLHIVYDFGLEPCVQYGFIGTPVPQLKPGETATTILWLSMVEDPENPEPPMLPLTEFVFEGSLEHWNANGIP
jgi:hypothetical protein